MIKLISTCLLFVVFLHVGNAQSTFKKTFGGTGDEISYWLELLPDGSCITCGRTSSTSNGDLDALLVNFDASGNVIWSKNYGTPGNDFFRSVKPTADGGFIAVGASDFDGGDPQMWALKTDAGGNVVWQKFFGEPGTNDQGRGLAVLPDAFVFGGFSGFGTTFFSFVVMTDLNGNLIWAKMSGAESIGGEIIQLPDNELLFVSGYDGDGALIRLDYDGNLINVWQMSGFGSEAVYFVKSAIGGGFIASDHSWSPSGSIRYDPWLIRLDEDANVLWSKTYNLGSNCRTNANPTSDSGFVFCAYDFASLKDAAILVKTNKDGDVLWAKGHAFPPGETGNLHDARQLPDGGYIAIGYCTINGNGTDLFLIRTDKNGNVIDCCPPDFPVEMSVYDPSQFSNGHGVSDYQNNQSGNASSGTVVWNEVDRCDGESCCKSDAGDMVPADLTICSGDTATFQHMGNQQLANGQELRFILFTDPNDPTGSIVAVNTSPVFILNPPVIQYGTTYYVAAVATDLVNGQIDPNDPCLNVSNAVTVKSEALSDGIPNAFSPNNDNANDAFRPLINCRPAVYHLKIYNRWGEMIFETTDYRAAWNGTVKGNPAPVDTYFWTLKTDAQVDRKRGEINLLR